MNITPNTITETLKFTAHNNPILLTLITVGAFVVLFTAIYWLANLVDPTSEDSTSKVELRIYSACTALILSLLTFTLVYLAGQPRTGTGNIAQLATTITQQTNIAPNIESLTGAITEAQDGQTQAFTATDSNGQLVTGSITFDAPVNTREDSTATVTVTFN